MEVVEDHAGGECFKCGKPCHFARECPGKGSRGAQPEPKQGPVVLLFIEGFNAAASAIHPKTQHLLILVIPKSYFNYYSHVSVTTSRSENTNKAISVANYMVPHKFIKTPDSRGILR
ncbi:hypothetical protein RJT34_17727 [Clitoria ternatea]|uniref:CCHC-type domain-containing protein n=1 Tax=Clitoria ternatea TaxID=43366 RepID=A0AAN9PDD8_CLITE